MSGQLKAPKILYTTADSSFQSGAFRSLLYMGREIQQYGYQSILVLHSDITDSSLLTAYDAQNIHFMPLPQLKRGRSIGYYLRFCLQNIQATYKLVRIIRKEQVSIVHINEIFDIYAAFAARIAGVPCVWHIRAGLAFRLGVFRPLLPRIATFLSSTIIVVSGSVRDNLFKQSGMDPDKVFVIHNPGPDPAEFHPGVDGTSVRQEFDLDENACLVVLVGKLFKPKGHETLIRSIPQVLASFPNTYFMIVGGTLPGAHHSEYETGLKALPGTLGVQESVIFTGFRTDIPQIMAAADIVTHCSIYPDPFPGVVLQGMAIGKPVIAPDLGGPKEQIENYVSGLLIEPGNPTSLAEAICSLLGDEEKRTAMGQAATRRVRSTFTAQSFFQKLSALYDRFMVEPQYHRKCEDISPDSFKEAIR